MSTVTTSYPSGGFPPDLDLFSPVDNFVPPSQVPGSADPSAIDFQNLNTRGPKLASPATLSANTGFDFPLTPGDPRLGAQNTVVDGQNANGKSASDAQVAMVIQEVMQAMLMMFQQLLQTLFSPPKPSILADSDNGPANVANLSAVPAEGVDSATSPATATTPTATSDTGGLHLPPELQPYAQHINEAAAASGVPASVIAGQIWAESRGKLSAKTINVNGENDSGLMQVNADTFKGVVAANPDKFPGGGDVNNPRDNIMAGALYLGEQQKAFGGRMDLALRAYNSGPDKVNRNDASDNGGIGGRTYPKDVLQFADIISSGKGALPA